MGIDPDGATVIMVFDVCKFINLLSCVDVWRMVLCLYRSHGTMSSWCGGVYIVDT